MIAKLSYTLMLSGTALFLTGASAPSAKPPEMPTVTTAQVPMYPEIVRKAHIEGTVKLHVTTDRHRISKVDSIEGHPMLVKAATENVKTWVFLPHEAMSFDVSFSYSLMEAICDADCRCDSVERPRTVLRLPTTVEINATEAKICDPVEIIIPE